VIAGRSGWRGAPRIAPASRLTSFGLSGIPDKSVDTARPEYAEDFGPNAAVRCANCAAAHPGYSFRLFDPKCEKTVRPDFTEVCAFPGQVNANDLERFVYTLNGSTWPKVGVIGG